MDIGNKLIALLLLLSIEIQAQSNLDKVLKRGGIIVNGLTFLKGTDEEIVKEAKRMGFI